MVCWLGGVGSRQPGPTERDGIRRPYVPEKALFGVPFLFVPPSDRSSAVGLHRSFGWPPREGILVTETAPSAQSADPEDPVGPSTERFDFAVLGPLSVTGEQGPIAV